MVWAHHIFTVGIDTGTRAYFITATIIIAAPTGIKIFSWLGTSMEYVLFFFTFINLGVRICIFIYCRRSYRVILSNSSLDAVLYGTYYVVAHFHYDLRIRAVFALIAVFINWSPLITGLTINPKWLKIHFFTIFVRVNLTFPHTF